MKTVAVWLMLSLSHPNAEQLQFPSQSACEHYAHEVYWRQEQAWQHAGSVKEERPVQAKCVKTNIQLESDDAASRRGH
jgi:hypothetical protein